ncbi:MAG TPA: nickel pincer cofactor biosynthesis protein LarC [Terriglobales bacterium]|nr:nickel pincer cofactor biosynthesis protein LarC [Terriglobales bacterium]
MKCLYFDAFSGISGDMTVGALLALGVPLEHLTGELARLALGGYRLAEEPRSVNGIAATKFQVHLAPDLSHHSPHHHDSHDLHHSHHHRHYRDIRALIAASSLAAPIKATAQKIFATLAAAEGHIHGVPPDEVTFHEVGAVDSIVDIVGCAIGLHWLGVERCYVSPLPLGTGIIRSQHGRIPVPAPATAELLKGFPTSVGEGEVELVTPTGAAIIAALALPQRPQMQLEAIGYGAGDRVWSDRPNLLRVLLGKVDAAPAEESIVVLQCNIDDLNPEIYEHVLERLFEAGALDVFLTPVQMKKSRPGCLLTALCGHAQREAVAAIILSETSSIGLRQHQAERIVLPRQVLTVTTAWGPVRIKVATAGDGQRNIAPEYEDCRRIAKQHGVPLKHVYLTAQAAALSQAGTGPDRD